jgi:hypothetical protein
MREWRLVGDEMGGRGECVLDGWGEKEARVACAKYGVEREGGRKSTAYLVSPHY